MAYERVLHSFSVSISHIFNVLHSSTSACKTFFLLHVFQTVVFCIQLNLLFFCHQGFMRINHSTVKCVTCV